MAKKYIDADKLIAEIRKRLKSLHGWETKNKTYYRNLGKESAYDVVLSIITSLQQEQPEVELEKEIDEYFNGWRLNAANALVMGNQRRATPSDMKAVARHFAEWGAIHFNARK